MKKIYTIVMCLAFYGSYAQNAQAPLKARHSGIGGIQNQNSIAKSETPTHRNCGTMENLAKMIQEDPSLKTRMEEYKQNLQNYIAQNYDALSQERVI